MALQAMEALLDRKISAAPSLIDAALLTLTSAAVADDYTRHALKILEELKIRQGSAG